jgi:ABC-type antimicrobial peptide transport system permease subunit
VVLIDSDLARTYFPGRDPIGQMLTIPHWGAATNVAARIVGVVGHIEQYGLDGSAGEKPQLYFSFYQLPDDAVPVFRSQVALAVRTQMHLASVMPAIQQAVHEAGGDQSIFNVESMESFVQGSIGQQRLATILLVSFAAVALVLAFVGTYGVISYSITRRVREIGIRMALGANKRDILRIVVGQSLQLSFVAIAIGAAAGFVLAQAFPSFSRLLYGVGPRDPLAFTAAAFVLIGAAILASYVPARRALRLEPIIVLRNE